MYWGTSRWSPFELFEAYTKAKEYCVVAPIVEIGEYHWFHREKVELYMAELYNKIGEKKHRLRLHDSHNGLDLTNYL